MRYFCGRFLATLATLLILNLGCCYDVFGQDEKDLRDLFLGTSLNQSLSVEKSNPHFIQQGKEYHFDLNGDQFLEILTTQKRDGVDWFMIKNSSRVKIFETKIFTMGVDSKLVKIKFVNISSNTKALILFYDEGLLSGVKKEATSKIVILSYENNHLGKITRADGPVFFHEKESFRDIYWRRSFNVNVYDIDHDGQREIVTQFNKIQKVMKYFSPGKWLIF